MRSWNWNGKAQLKEEARGICRRKRTPKKIQLGVSQERWPAWARSPAPRGLREQGGTSGVRSLLTSKSTVGKGSEHGRTRS